MNKRGQAELLIVGGVGVVLLLVFAVVFYFIWQSSGTGNETASNESASNENFTMKLASSRECFYLQEGVRPSAVCTPGVGELIELGVLCTPGFSMTRRNVPQSVKDEAYKKYGVLSHSEGEYEIDHLVPLELGGTNDLYNLWPQPNLLVGGYKDKDKVENWLREQVCTGGLMLSDAQRGLMGDWTQFTKIVEGGRWSTT